MEEKKIAESPGCSPSGDSAINSVPPKFTKPSDQSQEIPGHSTASQRYRILKHLREVGTLTTLQARQELDICHPGMRICELRQAGHEIVTVMVFDTAIGGGVHQVAEYSLLETSKQMILPGMQCLRGGLKWQQ